MSVLSFPRIYFKGMMEWDPCTFNNNDFLEMPTYDGVNAALNWPFLAGYGITPQNFVSTLRPWAIGLLPDCVDQPGGDRVPAEWNMFGTHSVSFVESPKANVSTVITGGALSPTDPVTQDALIGGPVTILGDSYPGSGQPPGPGRLVDTNPASYWSSQIYFQHLSFGGDKCRIHGPRSARMHSRWLNLGRIYTGDSRLTQPAASVACCFQAAIPYADVQWPAPGTSTLADKLNSAASQSPALGIMVRFTAYVNVYFKNGVLNDIPVTPNDYKDLAAALAAAWNEFNSTGKSDLFFSNPCYSNIVGTLGVWDSGEVETAPVGRFLAANAVLTPIASVSAPPSPSPAPMALGKQAAPMASSASAPPPPPPVGLGPVVVNVDYGNQLISLDLGSAIPETGTPGIWPSDLTKANFGPLTFGVMNGTQFTPIAQIDYTQYSQGPYEASAGIVDIPFSSTIPGPAQTQTLLQDPSNSLAVQVEQSGTATTALLEEQYSAQTDRRGIYLDQNETTSFELTVYNFGVPSPNTTVLVAQYDQGLGLVPASATPLVFLDGQQQVPVPGGPPTNATVVTSDANGVATVTIGAVSPGYTELAFFPYSGEQQPLPLSLGAPPGTVNPMTYAFYTTVRVLPFDDALPQRFVDVVNAGSQNSTVAWQFVYNQILYVYDMLFSVMAGIINLGNQQAVQDSIGSIWWAISKEASEDNTLAMPITRDMSAGKRKTLQLWIYLVSNGFNVPNFNVNSIPEGWTPPNS